MTFWNKLCLRLHMCIHLKKVKYKTVLSLNFIPSSHLPVPLVYLALISTWFF